MKVEAFAVFFFVNIFLFCRVLQCIKYKFVVKIISVLTPQFYIHVVFFQVKYLPTYLPTFREDCPPSPTMLCQGRSLFLDGRQCDSRLFVN
jgi:hypothetical protein